MLIWCVPLSSANCLQSLHLLSVSVYNIFVLLLLLMPHAVTPFTGSNLNIFLCSHEFLYVFLTIYMALHIHCSEVIKLNLLTAIIPFFLVSFLKCVVWIYQLVVQYNCGRFNAVSNFYKPFSNRTYNRTYINLNIWINMSSFRILITKQGLLPARPNTESS